MRSPDREPVVVPDLGSTLLGVLTGRDPQVLQAWHSAREVPEIAATVAEAGWTFAHLDSAVAQTKPEILAALGRALDFPAHYGVNYDALSDCLDDLLVPDSTGGTDSTDATGSPAGVLLLWDAWPIVAEAEPAVFDTVRAILEDHTGRARPFVVLLRRA